MPTHRRLLTAAVLFAVTGAGNVQADPITYTFNVQTYVFRMQPFHGPSVPFDEFSVSFTLPDYVTHTGLFELPSPATVQGTAITHAGTNAQGQWVFGNGVGDHITDSEWQLDFDTLEFQLIRPPWDPQAGYITMPTRVTGYFVQGLTTYVYPPDHGLWATAQLEITDDAAPVPEPGTLLLLGAGALGLLSRRRDK